MYAKCEKLVKDVMVPIVEYPTINYHATIGEAIKILRKSFRKEGNVIISGHRSIIVLDNSKKIVGILTLRSLLKAIELDANKKNTFSNIASWALFFAKNEINEHLKIQVWNIMRSVDLAYIYDNQTITDAVHTILTKQVNSLPVLASNDTPRSTLGEYDDNDRSVLGIIRTIDIFDIIGDIIEIEDNIITFPQKPR